MSINIIRYFLKIFPAKRVFLVYGKPNANIHFLDRSLVFFWGLSTASEVVGNLCIYSSLFKLNRVSFL